MSDPSSRGQIRLAAPRCCATEPYLPDLFLGECLSSRNEQSRRSGCLYRAIDYAVLRRNLLLHTVSLHYCNSSLPPWSVTSLTGLGALSGTAVSTNGQWSDLCGCAFLKPTDKSGGAQRWPFRGLVRQTSNGKKARRATVLPILTSLAARLYDAETSAKAVGQCNFVCVGMLPYRCCGAASSTLCLRPPMLPMPRPAETSTQQHYASNTYDSDS